ncbi:MAG: nucleotide pyrophosphatase [Chloroflexota bacterium]|nr:MAG: nucleotide pyrophosphatase [Chloroflexota bacterium]
MPVSNRVLVIGLDGATWDVLDPWLRDGSLPNLAKLRQNGSWGPLRSTLPPLTAAAWSTFMTGKRPGKHGVFHFINLFDSDTTEKPRIVNARSIKSSSLWDILGHHQRKSTVINVPMTYPPRPVNGTMITCFLTPKNASVFTYPFELSQKLTDYIIDLDRFIDSKPYQDGHEVGTINPSLSLLEEFREMTEKRARTTLSLMDSQPWDFFMVVFMSTDRMGHYLWPYHRSADPNDPPEIQALCRGVHQYYQRLDEIVGELVTKAGENVTVVVMSDHGMGSKYSKRVHGNFWLQQHGWLATVQTNGARSMTGAESWLKQLGLPRDKIGRLMFRLPGVSKNFVKKVAKSRSVNIDTEGSKAYFVPIYDNVAGIRINLVGEDKTALCQEIIQELEKIVDPETGEKVVEQIYRGEEYYYGPYAVNIPDLIVIIKPDYGWGHHLGHYSSVVTKVVQAKLLRGDHRLNGIFLANGPGIMSNPEPLTNLAIEDVAPTILYMLGLPVPSDIDGRVLTETLEPDILESRPVRYGEPVDFWPNKDEALFSDEVISAEDEAEIHARLRALGYLE